MHLLCLQFYTHYHYSGTCFFHYITQSINYVRVYLRARFYSYICMVWCCPCLITNNDLINIIIWIYEKLVRPLISHWWQVGKKKSVFIIYLNFIKNTINSTAETLSCRVVIDPCSRYTYLERRFNSSFKSDIRICINVFSQVKNLK